MIFAYSLLLFCFSFFLTAFCTIVGINFFMYHYGSEECFYFDISSPESDRSDPSVTSSLPHIPYSFTGEEMYPYLLVSQLYFRLNPDFIKKNKQIIPGQCWKWSEHTVGRRRNRVQTCRREWIGR